MKAAILQLYQEATGEDYLYDFDPIIAEEFAELIVLTCIRLCEQVDLFYADECIDAIREHFGVEK